MKPMMQLAYYHRHALHVGKFYKHFFLASMQNTFKASTHKIIWSDMIGIFFGKFIGPKSFQQKNLITGKLVF